MHDPVLHVDNSGEINKFELVVQPKDNDVDRSRDMMLLSRYRDGDTEACAELLKLYMDRAVNLAYGIVRNRADAEDAAQDAFIRVFTSSAVYRGESSFFSWLYRVVINVSINMTKKRSWSEVSCEIDLQPGETDSGDVENRLLMNDVLGAMPVHLRTILVLREIDQLSYDEVAEILDLPMGTVKSRLSVARDLFRRKYKEMIAK